MSKLMGRHRGRMLAGSLVAMVLLASSIVATSFGINATRMAQRAQNFEEMTNAALVQAEQDRHRAAEAEDRLAEMQRERQGRITVFRGKRNGDDLAFSFQLDDPNGCYIDLSQYELVASAGETPSNEFAEIERSVNEKNANAGMGREQNGEAALAANGCPETDPSPPNSTERKRLRRRSSQHNATSNVRVKEWMRLEKSISKKFGEVNGQRLYGELAMRLGQMQAAEENWQTAEFCFREAKRVLNNSLEFDNPNLFRVRLLLSESMMAQEKFCSASKEIQAVSYDTECILEELPQDVAELLGRLKTEASRILGRDI